MTILSAETIIRYCLPSSIRHCATIAAGDVLLVASCAYHASVAGKSCLALAAMLPVCIGTVISLGSVQPSSAVSLQLCPTYVPHAAAVNKHLYQHAWTGESVQQRNPVECRSKHGWQVNHLEERVCSGSAIGLWPVCACPVSSRALHRCFHAA